MRGVELIPSDKDLIDRQHINLFTSVESIATRKELPEQAWVSKTDLWFDLAQQGVWVQGSWEGFGWKFIEGTIKSPLVIHANINE